MNIKKGKCIIMVKSDETKKGEKCIIVTERDEMEKGENV